jgi:hypothetical protein
VTLRQRLKQAVIFPMLGRSTRQREPLAVMEARSASTAPDANDSSYFCALGPEGSSLVFRAAFRHQKPAELWVAVRLDGGRELRAPEADPLVGTGFALGGLTLECREVGQRWSVRYDGPLRDGAREVAARLDLEFVGASPVVDFRDAKDDWQVARVVGEEHWTRAFFDELRELHQTHLEQAGSLRGTVTLDGVTREVNWPAVRDHSYGKRRWGTMTRHGWFCAVLEDGTSVCVSRAKYAFLGEMGAGYVVKGGSFDAVVRSEALESFAGPPRQRQHAMWLETKSGRRLTLRSTFTHAHVFDLDGGVYRIREGLGRIELDGVPGRGIAELGWNRAQFPDAFLGDVP